MHMRIGLPFNGWSSIDVILSGESYTALAEGLQAVLHPDGRRLQIIFDQGILHRYWADLDTEHLDAA